MIWIALLAILILAALAIALRAGRADVIPIPPPPVVTEPPPVPPDAPGPPPPEEHNPDDYGIGTG